MTDTSAIDPNVRATMEASGISASDEELVMFSVLLPILRMRVQPLQDADLGWSDA